MPYATIGNGATVTLAAPTTGTTQGLAFFGDPNAPSSTPSKFKQRAFGGGATMNITGALYFPTETVQFNNGISNPSGCTQLIAGIDPFSGRRAILEQLRRHGHQRDRRRRDHARRVDRSIHGSSQGKIWKAIWTPE